MKRHVWTLFLCLFTLLFGLVLEICGVATHEWFVKNNGNTTSSPNKFSIGLWERCYEKSVLDFHKDVIGSISHCRKDNKVLKFNNHDFGKLIFVFLSFYISGINRKIFSDAEIYKCLILCLSDEYEHVSVKFLFFISHRNRPNIINALFFYTDGCPGSRVLYLYDTLQKTESFVETMLSANMCYSFDVW